MNTNPRYEDAARRERAANNAAAADREAAQAARTSLLGRIAAGCDFDPDDLSDEELASVFPAFAVVMCDVVYTLAKREERRIEQTA